MVTFGVLLLVLAENHILFERFHGVDFAVVIFFDEEDLTEGAPSDHSQYLEIVLGDLRGGVRLPLGVSRASMVATALTVGGDIAAKLAAHERALRLEGAGSTCALNAGVVGDLRFDAADPHLLILYF